LSRETESDSRLQEREGTANLDTDVEANFVGDPDDPESQESVGSIPGEEFDVDSTGSLLDFESLPTETEQGEVSFSQRYVLRDGGAYPIDASQEDGTNPDVPMSQGLEGVQLEEHLAALEAVSVGGSPTTEIRGLEGHTETTELFIVSTYVKVGETAEGEPIIEITGSFEHREIEVLDKEVDEAEDAGDDYTDEDQMLSVDGSSDFTDYDGHPEVYGDDGDDEYADEPPAWSPYAAPQPDLVRIEPMVASLPAETPILSVQENQPTVESVAPSKPTIATKPQVTGLSSALREPQTPNPQFTAERRDQKIGADNSASPVQNPDNPTGGGKFNMEPTVMIAPFATRPLSNETTTFTPAEQPRVLQGEPHPPSTSNEAAGTIDHHETRSVYSSVAPSHENVPGQSLVEPSSSTSTNLRPIESTTPRPVKVVQTESRSVIASSESDKSAPSQQFESHQSLHDLVAEAVVGSLDQAQSAPQIDAGTAEQPLQLETQDEVFDEPATHQDVLDTPVLVHTSLPLAPPSDLVQQIFNREVGGVESARTLIVEPIVTNEGIFAVEHTPNQAAVERVLIKSNEVAQLRPVSLESAHTNPPVAPEASVAKPVREVRSTVRHEQAVPVPASPRAQLVEPTPAFTHTEPSRTVEPSRRVAAEPRVEAVESQPALVAKPISRHTPELSNTLAPHVINEPNHKSEAKPTSEPDRAVAPSPNAPAKTMEQPVTSWLEDFTVQPTHESSDDGRAAIIWPKLSTSEAVAPARAQGGYSQLTDEDLEVSFEVGQPTGRKRPAHRTRTAAV